MQVIYYVLFETEDMQCRLNETDLVTDTLKIFNKCAKTNVCETAYSALCSRHFNGTYKHGCTVCGVCFVGVNIVT
jgi:hypothetical protein